jgi:hypothetical protein
MGAQDSNLSHQRYGYNVVVATTQASINATMKMFLDNVEQPVVNVTFVADDKGNPVRIDFNDVQKVCDPFGIPANAQPASDPNIKKLLSLRFMAGLRARLGIPTSIRNPRKVPDLVVLGGDTSAVTFNLLCSEFELVELSPGGWGGMSWTHLSQSDGDPWLFQSKVDLRMSTVELNRYNTLPPDVRDRIKNLKDAFSIRQLLFDFTNAGLSAPPMIEGIQSGTKLYALLQQYFIGAYFNQIRAKGEPVLNVAIIRHETPTSTLAITDLNLQVCPFVGSNGAPIVDPTPEQARLATLAHLCETNNEIMPPAVPFTWNWIDENPDKTKSQRDFHGIVAIKRKTFAQFLRNQLAQYVSKNCYAPSVKITMDGLTSLWDWHLTPGQQPSVTIPESGNTVLIFSHSAETYDEAGLSGAVGQCRLRSGFELNVAFGGSKIVVSQHLTVWTRIKSGLVESEGYIVNKTINETITLSVNADGRLVVGTPETEVFSFPDDLHINWFLELFTQLNAMIDELKGRADSITTWTLTDIPIGLVQDFVFPGGRTFSFKDVAFSNHRDLVAHITYTTDQ